MNLALIVLPGILVGLGFALVVAALVPTQPRLSAALERIGTTSVSQDTAHAATFENRVGSAVLRRFSDSPSFKIPSTDLRLIGMSVNRYLYQKVLSASLGLLAPIAFGLIFQVLGITAFYIPALFGLPLALGGWFLPNLLVRDQAQEARTEFSRSVAVYMELVGSERISGAPPGKALRSAGRPQLGLRADPPDPHRSSLRRRSPVGRARAALQGNQRPRPRRNCQGDQALRGARRVGI